MKQIFNIILAFHFVLIAGGITVSAHYCGGTLVSKGVLVKAPACNHVAGYKSCDKKQESKGCCSEDFELFKIQNDFISSASIVLKVSILEVFSPALCFPVERTLLLTHLLNVQMDTGPPPISARQFITVVQSFLL